MPPSRTATAPQQQQTAAQVLDQVRALLTLHVQLDGLAELPPGAQRYGFLLAHGQVLTVSAQAVAQQVLHSIQIAGAATVYDLCIRTDPDGGNPTLSWCV